MTEEDGTEVDDDDVLSEWREEIFLLLGENETWIPATVSLPPPAERTAQPERKFTFKRKRELCNPLRTYLYSK